MKTARQVIVGKLYDPAEIAALEAALDNAKAALERGVKVTLDDIAGMVGFPKRMLTAQDVMTFMHEGYVAALAAIDARLKGAE